MRLSDIVVAFGAMMGVSPTAVDERYVEFVAGKTPADPDTSVWDIIWGTKSLGTAICYALLWLFGWFSWGLQYVVKLVGDILLTAGWALSPIFLSFFMLRPMAGVAQKYLVGLVALVFWPFGWVLASVVTNAMLEAAAVARLVPVFVAGYPIVAPALTVLLIGSWMVISAVLAPWITSKIFLMGMNPVAAFAGAVGGVAQTGFAGGVGGAVATATAGVGAGAVVAAAAGGALAAGAESAARGGASARFTGTAIGGLSGLNAGGLMRRHAVASEDAAAAQRQQAESSQNFTSAFSKYAGGSRSGFDSQPHHDNPNQAAIDIESHASPKS